MKSVAITGASSGFGRQTAIELAKRGLHVFATMRDVAKGSALLDEAGKAEVSGIIDIVELDVTSDTSIRDGVGTILDKTGGTLDVLVNNAGYSAFGAFEDLPDEDCRAQMETNFFGALATTRAVIPTMREAGRGRILTITSNAVNSPHPFLSMYAASKWALEGWAEGLAMELAPFGIEVAVLQPGAHRTEFASNVQFVDAASGPYGKILEQIGPEIGNLDRWGRDPLAGAMAVVDAVCAERVPFRQQIGEDSQIFAALKGMTTYEVRALLLRAIVGMPGNPSAAAGQDGVLHDVLAHILPRIAGDQELSTVVGEAFGNGPSRF